MMKSIIEKQLVEWKEELAKQRQKQAQAQKVLQDTNQSILLIEGGIQAKEMLLKKIESSNQPSNTVEQDPESKEAPSKK